MNSYNTLREKIANFIKHQSGNLSEELIKQIDDIIDDDESEIGQVIETNNKETLAYFLIDVLDISISEAAVDTYEEDEIDIEEDIKQTPELNDNPSFRVLWDLLKEKSALTFFIEPYYIDRVYRDSFYSYYSEKHFEYSRYCKRLFVFDGNLLTKHRCDFADIPTNELQSAFIGFIVIRPLESQKIGRTLLNPGFFANLSDSYIRYANYSATMAGKRLEIEAFPYSMQDEETTSCAEITIINLLDYYSKKYAEYKYILPSDIIAIVTHNGFDRKLPTKGLDFRVMSKVLMEAGFYPVLYDKALLTGPSKFKRILHYYIESGIPMAVGVDVNKTLRHSMVCVGHGQVNLESWGKRQYEIQDASDCNHCIWLIDSADTVSQYIFMDDRDKPYIQYTWTTENNIDKIGPYMPNYLLVPLYKRMILEASDAYDICTSVLADKEFGIQCVCPDVGTLDNPLGIRLFMASARGLKRHRIEHYSVENTEMKECFINTPFPRFVWVCELFIKEEYPNKCIGEIIIDATAAPSSKSGSVIILHYANIVMTKTPKDNSSLQNHKVHELLRWEKFDSYRGNLHPPRKPTSI